VLGTGLPVPAGAPETLTWPVPPRGMRVHAVRAPHRLAQAGEPLYRPREAASGGRSNLLTFIINRMGIDIYAEWKGMSEAEKKAQVTGFSVEHGHVGYLHEAYHGEPYATQMLVPESFETGAPRSRRIRCGSGLARRSRPQSSASAKSMARQTSTPSAA
jgi:hypothetical protein